MKTSSFFFQCCRTAREILVLAFSPKQFHKQQIGAGAPAAHSLLHLVCPLRYGSIPLVEKCNVRKSISFRNAFLLMGDYLKRELESIRLIICKRVQPTRDLGGSRDIRKRKREVRKKMEN